jgi:hypothetical protein
MRYLLTLFLFLIALPGFGREALLEEKLTSPYPDRGDSVYINPAPLVVPRDMFPIGQLIRFELSRDKRFRGAGTQRSELGRRPRELQSQADAYTQLLRRFPCPPSRRPLCRLVHRTGNNDRYKRESETRLWRMTSGWERPTDTSLPADAPSSLLLSDMGEVIVHTRPAAFEVIK